MQPCRIQFQLKLCLIYTVLFSKYKSKTRLKVVACEYKRAISFFLNTCTQEKNQDERKEQKKKKERTDVYIRNKSEVATESDYSVVAHTHTHTAQNVGALLMPGETTNWLDACRGK